MALSEETIKICKATASVLVDHGEAITKRRYEILFANYPETRELFGEAPGDQHKKLAGAIVAYATNIDNLKSLRKSSRRNGSKTCKDKSSARTLPYGCGFFINSY